MHEAAEMANIVVNKTQDSWKRFTTPEIYWRGLVKIGARVVLLFTDLLCLL